MNFSADKPIKQLKEMMQESPVSQYVPLALYLGVEAYILQDLYYNHTTFSRLKRHKLGLFVRATISLLLVSLIGYTWSQNPEEAESNSRRNASAKIVYLISFALLAFELAYKSSK
jgi:hypothetical protein